MMSVFLASYREAVAYHPDHFNPVAVAGDERVRVILVCLEPGQFIPVHQPGVDLCLVVLEGEGELVAGDRHARVTPGSVAFVPAGEQRGIKADTRLIALHVVAPPPTADDHAAVMSGLQRGTWR
ncbi:MAG TPA: cupin domain-containing protein [Chloroflexota bacterium]|nr:cupin domain-containing protein [Chloroflexota bacterium]